MHVSWDDLAPWDMTQRAEVEVEAANGETATIRFSYYRNRMTPERALLAGRQFADPVAGDPLMAANLFCEVVAAWDVMGPWPLPDGTKGGSADEPVPLEPEIVALFSFDIRQAILKVAMGNEHPNPSAPSASPRR